MVMWSHRTLVTSTVASIFLLSFIVVLPPPPEEDGDVYDDLDESSFNVR